MLSRPSRHVSRLPQQLHCLALRRSQATIALGSVDCSHRNVVRWRKAFIEQHWSAVCTRRSSTSATIHGLDTIYALSTAPGRAAIAIVRISGPACKQVYSALCPNKKFPRARYAAFRTLHDPENPTQILDSGALVLSFPGPKTVTGEDVLEFHVHGGPAIVKAVLAAISRCATANVPIRYAEPGEFTRRAFMNDRMDLTQIESLGDTLSAVTEEQRRLSVQGTESGLARRYEDWRKLLLEARGELEALIDFSEDQHFDESPSQLASSVATQVDIVLRKIKLYSKNAVRGELLRNGISMSLIGSPNVGKSSLLNQLVGRNAAIVSQEAGTTRDIVEVGIDIGGFFCRLGDTAGLRTSSTSAASVMQSAISDIEKEGMSRAKEKALNSDVVILVLSIESGLHDQGHNLHLDQEVVETARQLLEQDRRMIIAINKMDKFGLSRQSVVARVVSAVQEVLPQINRSDIHCISCAQASMGADNTPVASAGADLDPGNIQSFVSGITQKFRSMTEAVSPNTGTADPGQSHDTSMWQEALGATERQRVLLDSCAHHLQCFLDAVWPTDEALAFRAADQTGVRLEASADPNETLDIVASSESLRAAARCLAKLTGKGEAGDVEEVLGVVFEK